MPKKVFSQSLSFLLGLTMTAFMIVPAWATSNYWITASVDGQTTYRESYPDGSSVDTVELVPDLGVGDVNVSVEGTTVSTTTRPVLMTGTLENGTEFQITEKEDRSLFLTTTNASIRDDINVIVKRAVVQHTITANSGPVDFKSNLGSDQNPTCNVSVDRQTVENNSEWSVTFSPKDPAHPIQFLNVRSAANGLNLISVNADVVTVAGVRLYIQRDGNSVKVSSDNLKNDLYITALTSTSELRHTLRVNTYGSVWANVSQVDLANGEGYSVTFTPDNSDTIFDIEITDGDRTAILHSYDDSVKLNGHTYYLTRKWNDDVVLEVPGMASDVSITATTETREANLFLDTSSNITCNYPESSSVQKGESCTIRLTPRNSADIVFVKISSDTDSVTLTGDETRFTLDDRSYRVVTWGDTSRTLYFDSFPGNIRITASTDYDEHTIYLETDNGCEPSSGDDRFYVSAGENQTVSFVPYEDFSIRQLVLTYKDETYRVKRGTSSITIHGVRCPVTWAKSGKVSIELRDLTDDITVEAKSNAETDTNVNKKYNVTAEADKGASGNISTVSLTSGSNKTITFTPVDGCNIQKIVVTRAGKEFTVNRNDSYITINGQRCLLTWSSNGKVSIALKKISADMNVKAVTDYKEAETPVAPVSPDSKPNFITNNFHKVYTFPDAYSSITVSTGFSTVAGQEPLILTITPFNGYTLEEITLRLGTETRKLTQSTDSFVYGGKTYRVERSANNSFVVTLDALPVDLTISSSAKYASGIPVDSDPSLNQGNTFHSPYITGTGQGYFSPAQTTTRAEAVVMLVRAFFSNSQVSAGIGNPFTDVSPDAWYASYILFANNQGLLNGLHNTGATFRPEEAITRAEYTEMAVRFSGAAVSGSSDTIFPDVQRGHWASATVAYAVSKGWIKGLPDGTFGADRQISRAEIVALTNRVLGHSADRGYIDAHQSELIQFVDVSPTHWAYYDVLEASNNHYVNYRTGPESWGL